uniref:Uncharacterized protein n=2 Tax=Haptolina brevifila TaxID=156173 RepID=A0A7S2GJV5_9EUKA|mmetsp:Transcript_40255/g.80688  ORF Transcript_40255/g.80688 Transcript_40255/m.80688 type:complete len:288 (+) Transcript_40255:122-985(+)
MPLFTGVALKPEVEAELEAMQLSLHLNAAVCAQKMRDYPSAKAACEYVFDQEPGNSKALYIYAKAIEGEGEYSKALGVLNKLLKAHPKNAEGRKLHAELKMQIKKQKAQLNGLFDRAQKENGEGLYTEAQLMPQRAEERARKAKAMSNPEIYTEDTLKSMDPVDACKMISQFQAKYENEEIEENERQELFAKISPLQQAELEEKYRKGMNVQDIRQQFWKGAIEDATMEKTPRARFKNLKERSKMFSVTAVLVFILGMIFSTAWTLARAAYSPLKDFAAWYVSLRFF